jgi:hypothetical protein
MKHVLKTAILVGALQYATSAAWPATVYLSQVTGQDTGSCPVTAPCLTIGYAYGQATASGNDAHIVFLSDGDWAENVNLNVGGFSVELTASEGVRANINPTGGAAALAVNLAAGNTVEIKKVRFGGRNLAGATNGILFNTGASLALEQVEMEGFSGGAVNFAPTN